VFYRAPSPGARPFVEVGDPVATGQVVGIVEAMKVLNQVTSEHSGRVVEILVDDGTPVQYAQQLLLIDTTDAGRPGAEL
jgi:acetyl-CoA carboxylase biotin carboxyl carrier protein